MEKCFRANRPLVLGHGVVCAFNPGVVCAFNPGVVCAFNAFWAHRHDNGLCDYGSVNSPTPHARPLPPTQQTARVMCNTPGPLPPAHPAQCTYHPLLPSHFVPCSTPLPPPAPSLVHAPFAVVDTSGRECPNDPNIACANRPAALNARMTPRLRAEMTLPPFVWGRVPLLK